jgi:hypothetical protein
LHKAPAVALCCRTFSIVLTSSYRFGRADFRVGELVRRTGVFARFLDADLAAFTACRQSVIMPIGMATIPNAISPLAGRSSHLISRPTTMSPRTTPQPKTNKAIFV